MVHLLYNFFQSGNDRKRPKQRMLDLKDWNLVLSSDMPQENPGSNACGLFTTAGCDIVSSGRDENKGFYSGEAMEIEFGSDLVLPD